MDINLTLSVVGLIIGVLSFIGIKIQISKKQNWRNVKKSILKVQNEIRNFAPDIVIGVSDGIVPAAIICTNFGINDCVLLNLPIVRDHGERIFPEVTLPFDLNNKKVLVVDNHIYSGTNLKKAIEIIKDKNPKEIKTFVAYKHVYNNPAIIPDLFSFSVNGTIKKVPWSFTKEHTDTYFS